MSAHDEDGGAHGDEEQAESCIHYKAGQGVTSEICGRKHHSHQLYPAACDWESHHMERLRFESYSFSIPTGTSHRLLICQWLSSDEDELKRILSQDPSESVSSKLRESAGITAAATGKGNIPELVSDVIPSKLQILEDSFLHLLSSFCAKCNMKKNDKKTLMNAAKSVLKNETEANLVIHRRVLVTWIDICKQYAGLGLTGRLLDDLVIDVINSVSYETGCLLRVKTRESTSTEINVCGQQINVQSGIEVSALSEEDLLQVIISSENKALGREIDIKQILAHIVCQALATAEHSPFGNQYYKTVSRINTRCSLSSFQDR
ncbi:uncharacterized protein [Ptychodera flava]|uniref:uncharacterized protein n=1 Tax=Ptychodera flava TaxID=63121 RepID=UPI00396A8E4D